MNWRERLKEKAKEALRPAKRTWNLARLPKRKRVPLGATPHEVVFSENKWKLLRYDARPDGHAFRIPILLVPSLINRHYVLDLTPGKSLVELLVAQGHDVFLLDWGTPGPEDRHLTFDDIAGAYLGRALRETARHSPTGKAHLLGYCLGGTLAAIHAAAFPQHVASLTALAAPVSFHEGGLLAAWCRTRSFDVGLMVDAFGNVPWQLMQGAFQLLRPTLLLSKTIHLVDRAWNDEFLDGFLALETWGNDNIAFPGACYRTYVEELYRKDAFVMGTLRLSGKPARMESLRCPVLAVTFEHDNIVPWRSAAALIELAGSPNKQRIHLPGGHVGAVVSRSAAKGLWPQLSGFWAANDGQGDRLRKAA
jgi:polyhydroxyalkanoate synthase subunit PhaC